MRKKLGLITLTIFAIFSLTGCSLLPSLLPGVSSSNETSSSNQSSQSTPSSSSNSNNQSTQGSSSSSSQDNDQYYDITFVSNGGTSVPSQQVKRGNRIVKPNDPRRAGYDFEGWYYDGSLWNFDSPVYSNMMLFAGWISNTSVEETYTATFYNDDYTLLYTQGGYRYGEQVIYNGPTPVKPESTKREGFTYTFIGWDKDLIIRSNTSFYAVYQERENSPISWGDGRYINPSDDNVGYSVYQDNRNDMTKIEIRALDGTLDEGSSFKDGTPEPFMKLRNNRNKISYKFNYSGCGIGTIYMRAVMDTWNSNANNSNLDYYYSSSQNNTGYEGQGNFALMFNGTLVDYSHMRGVTYAELLSNGEQSPYLDSSYSPVADCEIGEIEVCNGVNEFEYIRLSSYNLMISDFVIVIKNIPTDHVHQYSYEWSHNDYAHWHACTSGDGSKANFEQHTYGEETIVRNATCYQSGVTRKTCSTCGYVKETIVPITDHSWGVWQIVREATCTASGLRKRICEMCHTEYDEIIPQKNHTFGHIANFSHEGCATATVDECVYCQQQAFIWNATDYDRNLSNDVEDSGSYVRFATDKIENENGVESRGTHIVYKVYSNAAYSNVKLSFEIEANVSSNCVFDLQESDTRAGYEPDGLGDLVKADKRYGLAVNGQKITLTEDQYYGAVSGNKEWYYWPVSLDLVAGENIIDIYCLGSYRARMYTFMISGFHMATSNVHSHSLGPWESDDAYHWRECVNANCPFTEDTQIDKEKHTYVLKEFDPNGYRRYECSVCGRVREYDASSGESLMAWSTDDLIAACTNENLTVKTYADGTKGIKSSGLTGEGKILLNYTSQTARKANFFMRLSVKVTNCEVAGFWRQNSAEKVRIYVNGEKVEPPVVDINFKDEGLDQADEIASDNGTLSIPLWVYVCQVDLVAGENTIDFSLANSNYSFFVCGAKLMAVSQ